MEKMEDITMCKFEMVLIAVDFIRRKHDYFVVKCTKVHHINEANVHVSHGNPEGYTVGPKLITKEQYNDWFGVDYDAEEEVGRQWDSLSANIVFLYEHRKEIFARSDFYMAQTPLSVLFVGMIRLGELLKAYEMAPELFMSPCSEEGCGGSCLLYYMSGSPLSGTMVGRCVCTTCGKQQRFEGSHFSKRMNVLHDIKAMEDDDQHSEQNKAVPTLGKMGGRMVINYDVQLPLLPNCLNVTDVVAQLREAEKSR